MEISTFVKIRRHIIHYYYYHGWRPQGQRTSRHSAYSYTATTPDTYITNMNAKPNGGAFPKTACLAQSLRSQHNISLCTNTTNSIHYGNRCKS